MKTIPSESATSIKEGLWFVHSDGVNTIKAWGSFTNGKEEVYFNDKLASENKNRQFKNEHTFSYEGDLFKVNFKMTNMMKGHLECRFYKNDTLLKAYKYEHISGKIFTLLLLPSSKHLYL